MSNLKLACAFLCVLAASAAAWWFYPDLVPEDPFRFSSAADFSDGTLPVAGRSARPSQVVSCPQQNEAAEVAVHFLRRALDCDHQGV